jgi:hypothetical protein
VTGFAPLSLGCQPEKGANTDTEILRNAPAANFLRSARYRIDCRGFSKSVIPALCARAAAAQRGEIGQSSQLLN